MASPIVGKIIKEKDKLSSLLNVSVLKIKVVIDAIPICINPITDAAAPAVLVKFSNAIGVSNGMLNETPINVNESIKVMANGRLLPVYLLNRYIHKTPDINVNNIPKIIKYLCANLRLILEHNTDPIVTETTIIVSR